MEKQNNITKDGFFFFFCCWVAKLKKMLVMHPIWGNEKTLRENYIMSVLSYLGIKKLKRMNI